MGATLSTVSAITKELYQGTLRKQLNSETTTARRIARTSENVVNTVGGKYAVFPTHIRRNNGVGARGELETLPAAGNQTTEAGQTSVKYLYGRVQLSGPTMSLVKSNTQAFVSALDLEMNGMKDDLAVDFNRQIYGNGTGAVAVVSTTSATVTTIPINDSIWLQDGMLVDIYDSTGATPVATSRTLSSITDTTVDISGAAVSVTAGDILVRHGSVGTSTLSTQREITGLGAILQSSGALFGITNDVWTANIMDNSGTNRALSESLMITMADTIRKRGGKVTAIFSNLGVRRSYFNLLSQQRRFTNTKEFEGGFTGLSFTTDAGDIPVVVDTMAPLNSMKFLNEKALQIHQDQDWSFMDKDGSMWSRLADADGYEATMFSYRELGTTRRNTHGSLDDLIES